MFAYLIAIVLAALLIVDWRQTLTIARNPGKWTEINFILGPHPTVRAVHIYFACVLAAMLAFAACAFIPDIWRAVPLAVGAGIEALCVWMNKRHGL